MEVQQVPIIIQIIDIAGRRKALILTCVLTAVTIGLGAYLYQPKVFQSDSLLSYQRQMVNTGRMSPDDNSQLKDVVSTLTQIVTSRTSLERIINNERLFEQQRQQVPIEDVVDGMRRNISITPSRNGDTFRIVYQGSDPTKVARVANTLAARFIEENMKYREERASETSAYTQEELAMAKRMLDSKESVMRDYKLKHFNEMADQRETNMSRLIALQNNYQSRQESIQDLERTRALLRDQIATRKELLQARQTNAVAAGDTSSQPLTSRQKLAQLRNELQSVESKYTAKHPRIVSLKKQIASMEQLAMNEPEEVRNTTQVDQTLNELEFQVKDITNSIANITKERENILLLINQYDEWVAAAPVREAEWSALTREYGELKRHYEFLMGQNLQAGSALNLERKQRGSQFKIEDSAQQPVKPVKPDFLRIMAIALFMGFGAGGAGAFLLEKIDTSFRFPEELEAAFPFEVLCSVPRLPLKKEIFRQRIWVALGTVTFVTWGGGIIVALGFLWKQGRIII